MKSEIKYGPSLKLPNLLVIQLCMYKGVSQKKFEKFIWYLEVPLDSYTIQAVANCFDYFPESGAIGKIPSTATMGFVQNRNMYEAFQDGIRRLAKNGGVPPITLDCVAWNTGHNIVP